MNTGLTRSLERLVVSSCAPLPAWMVTTALLLIGWIPAFAQHTGYSLGGQVTTLDTAEPVSHAKVSLVSPHTNDTIRTDIYTGQDGRFRITLGDSAAHRLLPSILQSAYPNPVAHQHSSPIAIPYYRPSTPDIPPTLHLYSLLGRRVPSGGRLAAGPYFYQLEFGDGSVTRARSLTLLHPGSYAFQPVRQALDQVNAAVVVEKPGYRTVRRQIQLTADAWTEYYPSLERQSGRADRFQVQSPDGRITVDLSTRTGNGRNDCLHYQIRSEGESIVRPSRLGLDFDSRADLGCGVRLVDATYASKRGQWQPLYGERTIIPDRFNALTVDVQERQYPERRLQIILRAYDEGVALRYRIPEQNAIASFTLVEDETAYHLPSDAVGYVQYRTADPYERTPIAELETGGRRPLTVEYPAGHKVSLMQAGIGDSPRMHVGPGTGPDGLIQTNLSSSIQGASPWQSSWHLLSIARSAEQLAEQSYLPRTLAPSSRVPDTSWIQPGKAIRVMNLKTESAKSYIDFAADHNLQYVLLGTGWYGDPNAETNDATTAISSLDVRSVIDYGRERGVGVMLYVEDPVLQRQFDAILPVYERWGAAGIKFGFVKIYSQEDIRWLNEAVRKAAEHELVVNVHDWYRPRGLSRTYPNLLTVEGIRGNELMPTAEHNTQLPFTRFIAGAADYTIAYYDDEDLQTTHAHQLALSVIYYSPQQFLFWYDGPNDYRGEPEMEFFEAVPTVWDETRVLEGRIGDYITVARRRNNTWFVGSITDGAPRQTSLPLDFLPGGKTYVAHLYTDDDTVSTQTSVAIDRYLVDRATILELSMPGSGGAALRLVPVDSTDKEQYSTYP